MPHPAATPVSRREASGPGAPIINPVTGLSTDYLNHFTEALMALEMAADIPECIDDLRAWRPKTYPEHFAQSRFKHRDQVIERYHAAAPGLRREVDWLSASINRLLEKACAAVTSGADAAAVVPRAAAVSRPMIAELADLINATPRQPGEQPSSQAVIDAMFGR